ncbi:hypothetical protein LZZ85_17735, partial [Terrimonas sp. NA20]
LAIARSLDLFLLLFLHQGKKSKQSLRPPVEKKRPCPSGKKCNQNLRGNPSKKKRPCPPGNPYI